MTGRDLPRVWPIACAIVLLFFAPTALADIEPPRGLEWLTQREVELTNLKAFPDWVFVARPCSPPGPVLQEYCVIRPEQVAFRPQGKLYALPAREVRTAPLELAEEDALRIVRPAITDEASFFRNDARLVRPGFELDPWGSTTAKNIGVRSVRFRVTIDAVGPDGVKAHFANARYECRSGAIVEVPWGPDQHVAPLPRCPATDDRGQLIGPFDGGVAAPGITSGLAASGMPSPRLPLPRGHLLWLGVLVTSLSVLGVGLLLRKEPERGGKPEERP